MAIGKPPPSHSIKYTLQYRYDVEDAYAPDVCTDCICERYGLCRYPDKPEPRDRRLSLALRHVYACIDIGDVEV